MRSTQNIQNLRTKEGRNFLSSGINSTFQSAHFGTFHISLRFVVVAEIDFKRTDKQSNINSID